MSIDFERRGAIAFVTINRPEAMNALDVEHDRALAEAWKLFESEDTLRVAILTGAGGRSFCSGGDLKTYLPWRRDLARLTAGNAISFGGMTLAEQVAKPVVAAIQGYCVAGGLELAMACDIRICTSDSQFGLAEVKWGVLPGGGGAQRLPRLIPVGLALEMILTGDTVDAERAERIGLVNRIVPSDVLIDTAIAIAERIAANGPLAVKTAKRAVWQGMDRSLEEGLVLEGALQKQLLQTDDAEEGLRAFAERRQPAYAGNIVPSSSKPSLPQGEEIMSTASGARPRFSPARRIPLGTGDLLYLSGIICADEDARDNIELQTRRVFHRIAGVLDKHGASLANVVKTTAFLTDLADYADFNRVRVEAFMDCEEPPASTAVGAGSLLGIGTRVEIEVVAFVPSH